MNLRQKLSTLLQRFPFLISIPYFIYRQFQAKYTLGVVGLVLNREGKILLVEHVFHPVCPWGLPGGWVDRNEDPALAIQREMREELALEIVVKRVLLVGMKEKGHLDLAYLCEAQNEVGALSFELTGFQWADHHDLPPLHSFHYQAISQIYTELD